MKKVFILGTIVLFVMLLGSPLISCQEQPEPAPLVPAPSTPTPTPNSLPSEGSPSAPEPEEYALDQIIVKFKPETPIEAQEELHQKLGTTVIQTSPSAGFQVLQIPNGKTVPEMVTLYSEQAIVEYAEPNYIEHVN